MSTPPSTKSSTIPVATVDSALGASVVIDLRSPAEFAEDHLPGARNVPLFDDTDRAVIGLLYKQFSPDAAFGEGRALAAERIGGLVAEIANVAGWDVRSDDLRQRVLDMTAVGIRNLERELEARPVEVLPEGAVVLHCWRGGLRSRSVVALLRGLGCEPVFGLAGGYQAYRRGVLAELEAWSAPPAFVLRGLTGVGKTLVLRELERIRPGWTIDLEGAAGHRSSLLGMVGLEPCSQRAFESRLFARIREGFPGPVVFEGESRRVGDAIVPPAVWRALDGGRNVILEAPVERRVQVLMEDYLASDSNRPRLREQLAAVEERMEPLFPLVEMFDGGREEELVRVLLEHYYDPRYRHGEKRRDYERSFDSSDPVAAAQAIAAWIDATPA